MNGTAAESDRGTPAFSPGELVAGRWRVDRFLARGGMGEVYEATDLELGGRVALKTLLATRAESERAVERFRREVRLARRVTHQNVARVFDVGRHAQRESALVVYTMELLRGESLAERLRRDGPMQPRDAARIAHGAALGLAAAHDARVLHRDFKSSNIMLGEGASERAVVTDFGLARALDDDVVADASLSRDAPLLGTPAYMAPEQVEGRETGVAADIYAFGVVLFEMLTGELPFSGPSALSVAVARLTMSPPRPSSRAPWLDPAWDALILRCLARRPEERYPSMHALAEALEQQAGRDRSKPAARARAALDAGMPTVTLDRALEPARDGLAPARAEPADATPWAALAHASTLQRSVLALDRKWRLGAASLVLLAMLALAYTMLRPRALDLRPGTRPSLVVMARPGTGESDPRQRTGALAVMLSDELGAGHDLSIESMDALVDPPGDVRKLHALLGVSHVLDVSPISAHTGRVEVRLLDAASGEVVRTFGASLAADSPREAAQELARDVRRAFAVSEPPAELARAARAALPGNGEAIADYLDGKARYLHFDAAAAAPRLARAVELEPHFALAHALHARALADLGRTQEAIAAADRAVTASRGLSRELVLQVEAVSHEARLAWPKAAMVYRSLHGFYPDNRQYALDLARALVLGANPHEAWDVLEELIRKDPSAEGDPRVLLGRAEAANSMGNHKAQLPLAIAARDRAHQSMARALEARAMLAVANARVKLEGGQASIPDYEAAERLYLELGIAGGAAKAAVQAAWAYGLADLSEQALAASERTLRIARAGGDRRLEAIAIVQTGFALHRTDPALARSRYEQGLTMLREIGSTMNVIWTLGHLASLDMAQGKLADARARQEERASLSRAFGNDEDEVTALMNMGAIAIKAGDLDAAARAVETALPKLVDMGHTSRQGNALVTRAEVHLERAELELASDVLAQARARFQAAQSASGERVVLARNAQVARFLGQYERAKQLLREDIAGSQAARDPSGASLSVLALGELEADQGTKPNTAQLAEAVNVLSAQDMHDAVAWATSVLARAHLLAGDRARARDAARAALEQSAALESRVLRLRAIANATRVLAALGLAAEARRAAEPAIAEATRLGLSLRARELRAALRPRQAG